MALADYVVSLVYHSAWSLATPQVCHMHLRCNLRSYTWLAALAGHLVSLVYRAPHPLLLMKPCIPFWVGATSKALPHVLIFPEDAGTGREVFGTDRAQACRSSVPEEWGESAAAIWHAVGHPVLRHRGEAVQHSQNGTPSGMLIAQLCHTSSCGMCTLTATFADTASYEIF